MIRETVLFEEELLDPKVDFVFKRIFGSAESSLPLLDLLNAIFAAQHQPLLNQITLLNPALEQDWELDKTSILDIRAITCQGDAINIEMQMLNSGNFIKRTLYYWSELYGEHLQKGDDYHRLRRTITINLLNFKLFSRERLISLYQLQEQTDHECLTDLMQLVFIELDKPAWATQPLHLQQWIRFLTVQDNDELKQLANENPAIGEAYTMLNYLSHDPEERRRYFRRKIALMDLKSGLETARAEGVAEGRAEGKAEGAQEASFAVARRLLTLGMNLELISQATGLTVDQIDALREARP